MEEERETKMKEEREYFYRLIRLVVDIGTDVLLKVFQSEIGSSIKSFLKSKESKIKQLKKKKVLNSMQLEILNQTDFDETKLDISLLYTLLRSLTGIQEPIHGWDGGLVPYDMSPGAWLTRLKNVRNEAIAHSAKGSLVKSEFDKFWDEASKSLVELAGGISTDEKLAVEQKVKEVKDQPLLGDENLKLDALLKWEFEERCSVLESKLDALNVKVGQQGLVTEEMKSSLIVIEDHMKKLGIEDSSTGTSLLVKRSPSTSVGREQDIQAGQLKHIIEQMQRQLNQLISQKTWYVYVGQTPMMMGEAHPSSEDPINNPNALNDDEIIEYSLELGNDWEIFAIYLGYKQSQIDRLKDTYHRQIENLLRAMIQKWHDVVARCDENPKELLAAAFIRIRDNRTAEKILGNRKVLTEVKKHKPKDETAKKIHKITFGGSSGIAFNVGGPNSVNMFPGSVLSNYGSISIPSIRFGHTHTENPRQTPYNVGQGGYPEQTPYTMSQGGGHHQALPYGGSVAGYGHTTPYSDNSQQTPYNIDQGGFPPTDTI